MLLKHYIPHSHEDEKIILLLRRHWFIILRKLLFWAVVAIMPVLFYLLAFDIIEPLFTGSLTHPLFVLFVSVYYLYIWLFAFHSFVDYYLDVWIVTNKRIINIEQKGLFFRHVSEQKLYRIQDVTAELKGMFSTLLDYGTVYIQTAGEQARFVFKEVPRPQEVAKKVIKMSEQEKRFQRLLEQNDGVHTETI